MGEFLFELILGPLLEFLFEHILEYLLSHFVLALVDFWNWTISKLL